MSERRYAKGGMLSTTGPAMVKVRNLDGKLTEYWEPALNQWVPVIPADEVRALGEQALAALNAEPSRE